MLLSHSNNEEKYVSGMKNKPLTMTEDYSSPQVKIICMGMSYGPICGSFTGSGTQDYEDEDIWEGVN